MSMNVPMMNVRIVRVAMAERLMLVSVRVRFGAVPVEVVPVAMMLVVKMGVNMGERFVPVQVLVVFGEVQGNASRHQNRGSPEPGVRRLAEQRKRQRRADKRRG